jgi:hypothetical protein
LRFNSRLTVDGARPSRAAIDRIDSPATTARDISSLSTKVNTVAERHRSGGLMPPVFTKMFWIEV